MRHSLLVLECQGRQAAGNESLQGKECLESLSTPGFLVQSALSSIEHRSLELIVCNACVLEVGALLVFLFMSYIPWCSS